ncbi:hypothetical protein GUJ93_ZPchr0008g13903 [Zizania palustris]|uniref:Uncharacterized protein n=1 Tax=Zizania palustris TaxID=103762 RepID=A0A8J5RXC5_ZIZPA|nr:hypothetical protein GUJ93_ZPchr0008g13903 [Zizania palustris]
MVGPPAPSPASPPSSSPPGLRSPCLDRSRSGDHQPPHPPGVPLEASPRTSSPPGGRSARRDRRRGGYHQHPRNPDAPLEATPGSASSAPGRRSGSRGRRSGGDRQPQPPPPPAAAMAFPASVPPRRSFRISLRSHVRVLPLEKPAVTRKPRDPARPRGPSIETLASEWAKEKAASGATQEECILPFLQTGAPKKDAGPADGIEEAFRRLPLPYIDQEFNIDPIKKEELDNGTDPPPYVHLKHSLYRLAALRLVTAQSTAPTDRFAERKRLRLLRRNIVDGVLEHSKPLRKGSQWKNKARCVRLSSYRSGGSLDLSLQIRAIFRSGNRMFLRRSKLPREPVHD